MALQQPHLHLYTSPELNMSGKLSLKVKKLLTLLVDIKMIFNLQDVNFSINKKDNSMKTSLFRNNFIMIVWNIINNTSNMNVRN